MSFRDDLARFVVAVRPRPQAVLVGVATKLQQSIKGTGSPDPISGAPGQPVDTGFLRDSWVLEVRPGEAEISTNVAYAPGIEDGISASGTPIAFKSKVGGAHSVKMSVAAGNAFQRAVLTELGL